MLPLLVAGMRGLLWRRENQQARAPIARGQWLPYVVTKRARSGPGAKCMQSGASMTAIRFVFRVLATLLLAAAVVLAVVDATRSIAADTFVVTSLAEAWAQAAPDLLGDAVSAAGEGGLPLVDGLFSRASWPCPPWPSSQSWRCCST